MVADAEMAARDLEVLAERPLLETAAPPRGDPVRAAKNRRRRHGERCIERATVHWLVGHAAPAGPLAEEARHVRRLQVPERARERDHLPHVGREVPCQLARIDAAEAPADQADAPSMTAPDLLQALDETADHGRRRAEVPAELPAMRHVAEVAEEPAERAGREVARHEAREDEHRMAVAARGASQERVGRNERRELEEGAALEKEQTAPGRRDLAVHGARPGAVATQITYTSTIAIHSNRVPGRGCSIRPGMASCTRSRKFPWMRRRTVAVSDDEPPHVREAVPPHGNPGLNHCAGEAPGFAPASIDALHTNIRTFSTSSGVIPGITIFVFGSILVGSRIQSLAHT